MTRARLCSALTLGALLVVGNNSSAQRAVQRATIDGVQLIGWGRSTSTGSTPREPTIELNNRSGATRVVRVVSVVSVDGAERRNHRVISPATITLRPSQSRTVELHYAGDPLNDGVGAFTVYRFHITLEVDGHLATIESSNQYVCRIPVRR